MLSQIDDYTIPVTTPSGINIRIPGITNRMYQNILKYCGNRDYEGLELFFEENIFKKIPLKLNCIDKFYVLIAIRIFFIDENIVVPSGDNEITVSLNTILDNLDQLEFSNKTCIVDDVTFELGIPDKLYYSNIDDYLSSIIVSISLKSGKNIIFNTLSEKEKSEVLTYLPNKSLSVIYGYYNELLNTFKDFTIIEESSSFDIEKVSFNLISSNLIIFISSIYGSNIISFYEMLYVFVSKMKTDSQLYYSLSPIDSKMLFNFFKEELKSKEDSLKGQIPL